MTLQNLVDSAWWAVLQFVPQVLTAMVLAVVVWVSRLQFRLAESEERLRNLDATPKRRATPARDSELMATRFESQPWWGGINGQA